MNPAITAVEDDDLWTAFHNNFGTETRMALYDIDVDLLVAYRRAVRAGLFSEYLV